MEVTSTVTVVTSSIGRPELRQTIESVRNQNYPCKHFVFVNGPPWHERAREILKDYPEVTAFYLPEELGDYGVGPGAGDAFAAGPWLTNSDVIFFLNDDDFYDPDHVESVIELMDKNGLAWAYSLRRFVDERGKAFCDDDFDSLGYWPCVYNTSEFLVDNSCYAIRRDYAKRTGFAWTTPAVGDRAVLRALKMQGLKAGCTGRITVNYRTGGSAPPKGNEYYKLNTNRAKEMYPQGFPWKKPTVFVAQRGPAPLNEEIQPKEETL